MENIVFANAVAMDVQSFGAHGTDDNGRSNFALCRVGLAVFSPIVVAPTRVITRRLKATLSPNETNGSIVDELIQIVHKCSTIVGVMPIASETHVSCTSFLVLGTHRGGTFMCSCQYSTYGACIEYVSNTD